MSEYLGALQYFTQLIFSVFLAFQIKETKNYDKNITLDAACGIGALKIHKLAQYLGDSLNIDNLDYKAKGTLNEKVKYSCHCV